VSRGVGGRERSPTRNPYRYDSQLFSSPPRQRTTERLGALFGLHGWWRMAALVGTCCAPPDELILPDSEFEHFFDGGSGEAAPAGRFLRGGDARERQQNTTHGHRGGHHRDAHSVAGRWRVPSTSRGNGRSGVGVVPPPLSLSLIPTVNGNTVRSLPTHGQLSAAKGSSTCLTL
jgi:hypothetical protein